VNQILTDFQSPFTSTFGTKFEVIMNDASSWNALRRRH